MKRISVIHPIEPVYDEDSEILILGSFPSVKSREAGFFYGHPKNRFWKVIGALAGEEVPDEIPERKEFLKRHHIALWDVIGSCTIEGSSDTSIRDVKPNDIRKIIDGSNIRRIFVNGRKAEKIYQKYTESLTGIKAVCLPSTSPANAAWSLERLISEWGDLIPEGSFKK